MKPDNDLFIRPEQPDDFPQTKEVVTQAFTWHGPEVARLVEAIRASDNYVPAYSLVAEMHGQVVGHVMLSYTTLQDSNREHRILTLSPLSVDPPYQNQGIGGALIKAVTQLADIQGEPLVILEGSPNYYPRFGFQYSVPHGISIDLPSWAPQEAQMILPLSQYDVAIKGRLIYPPAFDEVNETAKNR